MDKEFLQKKLGLKIGKDIPMFCFIGRLAGAQKGLDILHRMLRRVDQTKLQFVVMGTGEKEWEERFRWLSTFIQSLFLVILNLMIRSHIKYMPHPILLLFLQNTNPAVLFK